MSRKKTHSEFIFEMSNISPDIKVLGIYEVGYAHIKVKHNCGNEWLATPANLLKGKGCPKCKHPSRRKTHSDFIDEMKEINPTIFILNKYTTRKSKVQCECTVCDHHWDASPGHLIAGRGCPKCSIKKQRLTHKIIKTRIKKVQPTLKIIGKYNKSTEGILTKCRVCNYSWYPTPNRLMYGTGCPECSLGGFNPHLPAGVYLYVIDSMYIGFGITGINSQRHQTHRKNLKDGYFKFEHIKSYYFEKGIDAQLIEEEIKRTVVSVNLGVDGFKTECCSIDYLPEIERIIDEKTGNIVTSKSL